MSIFAELALAPRDPILGLNEAFLADSRENKINLGVGVYFDEEGKIPLLNCVHIAEKKRVEKNLPRNYLPIDGLKSYNLAVQKLLFGEDSDLLQSSRVVTVQSLGGTGALKIGADFLTRFLKEKNAFVSEPTWANHRSIFEGAGFKVGTYAYYNATEKKADFNALKESLKKAPSNSVVILHACCHNPTGADLTPAEWDNLVEFFKEKQLIAFLDMAYQGFADSITEDAYALKAFSKSNLPFFVSSSFSKNFSMYGERVGALSVVTQNKEESEKALSQIKQVVRANYSNPPTTGSALVSDVLNSQELFQMWEEELSLMRKRIQKVRQDLVKSIQNAGVKQDFSFITQQRGMFSFTGLNPAQVERLKTEFGIYAVSSGRVCMAALNSKNVDTVARAIAIVL